MTLYGCLIALMQQTTLTMNNIITNVCAIIHVDITGGEWIGNIHTF